MNKTGILKGPQLSNPYEDNTLGEFIFNHAQKYSNNISQVDAENDKSETFRSMNERSVRLATHLRNWGVSPDDVIVTCSENSLDCPIPIISTAYVGAILSNIHPSLSVIQVSHLLSVITPTIIFVQESAVEMIEESLKNAKHEKCKLIVLGESTKYERFADLVKPVADETKQFKPTKVDIDKTGLILFSSGTTGRPKAICHSHKSFLHMIHRFNNSSVDLSSLLCFTTFYWVSALGFFFCCWWAGGTRYFGHKPNDEKVFSILQKYKIRSFFMAPIMTYSLTNYANAASFDTSSLTDIITGGSTINPSQFAKLDAIFPRSSTMFLYGMSEVGSCCFFDLRAERDLIKEKRGSCGRLGHNIEAKIVNVNTNKILGPNEKGELRIKSPSLMTGYYRGDASKDMDEDDFFKTGDIAYYDNDGCFFVFERLRDVFTYMSSDIWPSLIEGALLEHPSIADVVVFGIPLKEVGDVPSACVVLKAGMAATEEEIDAIIVAKLTDKDRLRGGVLFCNQILKTPSGKLMRKEMRNKFIVEITGIKQEELPPSLEDLRSLLTGKIDLNIKRNNAM